MVMGGQPEPVVAALKDTHRGDAPLGDALTLAVSALSSVVPDGAQPRTIAPTALEAAVLDRTRPRRAFKRLPADQLTTLLGASA